MSLLAKANGHEPHAWLSNVLARLPTTLNRDIETLRGDAAQRARDLLTRS